MRQRFRTKYGHFSADGREYVITRPDTPRPWVNVICPGEYGTIVSQAGAGYSWMTHATFNRLTRWEQDLVRDEWGKWIYCRDRDSGRHWSLGWQPVKAKPERYECRHGIGYTTIVARHEGIESEYTVFVPPGRAARDLAREAHQPLAPRPPPRPLQLPRVEPRSGARHAPRVPPALHRDRVRRAGRRPAGHQAPQHHRRARPRASRGTWSGRTWPSTPPARGRWRTSATRRASSGRTARSPSPRPCAGPASRARPASGWTRSARCRSAVTLAPGATREVVFTLGPGRRPRRRAAAGAALPATGRGGGRLAPHAALLGRAARTARGAHAGSRPSICSPTPGSSTRRCPAACGAAPATSSRAGPSATATSSRTARSSCRWTRGRTREQILLHAAHQFGDGTTWHWWHPLTGEGAKKPYNDDLLWLPFVTLNYLRETADFAVAARARALPRPGREARARARHPVRALPAGHRHVLDAAVAARRAAHGRGRLERRPVRDRAGASARRASGWRTSSSASSRTGPSWRSASPAPTARRSRSTGARRRRCAPP